jgi:predicted transcriptional regulator
VRVLGVLLFASLLTSTAWASAETIDATQRLPSPNERVDVPNAGLSSREVADRAPRSVGVPGLSQSVASGDYFAPERVAVSVPGVAVPIPAASVDFTTPSVAMVTLPAMPDLGEAGEMLVAFLDPCSDICMVEPKYYQQVRSTVNNDRAVRSLFHSPGREGPLPSTSDILLAAEGEYYTLGQLALAPIRVAQEVDGGVFGSEVGVQGAALALDAPVRSVDVGSEAIHQDIAPLPYELRAGVAWDGASVTLHFPPDVLLALDARDEALAGAASGAPQYSSGVGFGARDSLMVAKGDTAIAEQPAALTELGNDDADRMYASSEGVATAAPLSPGEALAALAVGMILAALALYSRFRASELKDQAVRSAILSALRERPCTVQELAIRAGAHYTTARYHVERMAREHLVVLRVVGRRRLVHLPGQVAAEQVPALVLSSTPSCDRLLRAVQASPGLSLREAAQAAQINKQTTHYHVQRLVAAGALRAVREKRGLRLFLA